MDLLRDAVGPLCVVLFLVYVVAITKFFAIPGPMSHHGEYSN